MPQSLDQIELLIVFALPGLVSMQVYRLLMPAKEISWSDVFLQAFFYSSFNLAILFPILFFYDKVRDSFLLIWLLLILFLFICPALWPWLLTTIFRSKWITKKIKIPYPSTWDYFFDSNDSLFMIVHLNEGDVIGGLWSDNSYAGSHPNDGDLYLEILYNIKEDGTFGEPIPFSKGLLIRKSEYTHIELFEVPEQNEE
ncbi:MAG: DUF6338 family protein [Balneolaceae bacterium]